MNMLNAIKYEFRGFRTIKIDYTRLKDQPLVSFTIGTKKNQWDEKNGIYELVTEFELMFGDEKTLVVFSSGFKIIDLEWLDLMAEQTVVNELFRTVFPYLTQKLQTITSDFRPGLVLPVFDMKKFDFTKKIIFNLNRVQPEKQNNSSNEEIN